MTFNAKQFGQQIVIPTLQELDQYAKIPFTNLYYMLVMGTIAQESQLGTFLVQEVGTAVGIAQIEPATLTVIMAELTPPELAAVTALGSPNHTPVWNVVNNLSYAVAVTRLFYHHSPGNPASDSLSDLFAYYKQWYNTPAGAATFTQWSQNFALTGL